MELEEFKEIQRRMWEEGDYPPVGRLIEPAAQILAQEAGVRAGQRVLDVGTGSGSVAVAAALAGAEVVGVDITDAWFDEAHGRANAAGVQLDLRLGDAEALPVDDGSFDVVLSSFAAIFAPRHDLVASELVRVCRDWGGDWDHRVDARRGEQRGVVDAGRVSTFSAGVRHSKHSVG